MPTTPTTVKIKRPAFHVWLDPREDLGPNSPDLDDSELEYHHVLVNNGDMLRAELEAGKLGVKPREAPQHLSTMWLWAALVRTGVYGGKFQAFKLACITYEPDQDRTQPMDSDDAELDELDEHPTGASSS